jgi:hypothetical protein
MVDLGLETEGEGGTVQKGKRLELFYRSTVTSPLMSKRGRKMFYLALVLVHIVLPRYKQIYYKHILDYAYSFVSLAG